MFNDVLLQGYPGGAAVDYQRVLDRRLTPIAHETLHAFGLGHSHSEDGGEQGEYGDTWCVMGYYYGTYIELPDGGGSVGPELNAPQRKRLGTLPTGRELTLPPLPGDVATTVTLAALERPEATGSLMVSVPVTATYTVEFRLRSGYDRNLPVDAVRVHRVRGADSYLTPTSGAYLLAGESGSYAGRFTVRVDAIQPAVGTATVTITR